MSILNYFFIGFAFIFLVDLLLKSKYILNHPQKINKNWGWLERIVCIVIWPLAALVFLGAFFKAVFRK